jgi:hypothetical protein
VLGKGVGYTVEESRREAIRDMAYRGRKWKNKLVIVANLYIILL